MGEVSTAPTPALESHTVLAGAFQPLLDGLMGQVREFVQLLNQARPAALTHADDGDARVVDVVQLVIAVGMKTRHAGGRQGSGGSSSHDRNLP